MRVSRTTAWRPGASGGEVQTAALGCAVDAARSTLCGTPPSTLMFTTPALAVPAFATAPKNPGALVVQAATVAPPTAPLAVVTPAGHGTQPPADAVPGLVTVP